jgi:hypothetical protein
MLFFFAFRIGLSYLAAPMLSLPTPGALSRDRKVLAMLGLYPMEQNRLSRERPMHRVYCCSLRNGFLVYSCWVVEEVFENYLDIEQVL